MASPFCAPLFSSHEPRLCRDSTVGRALPDEMNVSRHVRHGSTLTDTGSSVHARDGETGPLPAAHIPSQTHWAPAVERTLRPHQQRGRAALAPAYGDRPRWSALLEARRAWLERRSTWHGTLERSTSTMTASPRCGCYLTDVMLVAGQCRPRHDH